ncbi:MAG TPA: pyridoxamine 5'-phosphate oxidase family protein [Rhizomicrobium sp.]
MTYSFLDIARTPSVKAAEAANGSERYFDDFRGDRRFDRFGAAEAQFIAARDSFYMATVSQTGWPYVQHRGGPPGFLRLLDDKMLAFADFRGNRQYITLGNATANDRAALILMDYPNRRRMKIYARIEARDLAADPDLAAKLSLPGYKAKPERALLLHLEAFDWNCPQHITPRFTEAEIGVALQPTLTRLAALEAENAALKAKLRAGEQPSGDAG